MKIKIVITFCIIIMISVGYYLSLNNEDGKEREVRIVAEYQAIKQPARTKMVSYRLNRKFVMRWIVAEYTGQISDNELKKYYDQELLSNGWQQDRSHPGTHGTYCYYYKKDNLQLVLEMHGINTNTWALVMDYVDATY